MKTIQINVTGRVQGVCFRADTQKQAAKFGITGFVKNKKDGSVEIIARSGQNKLDSLVDWCHKGPFMAKVSNVIVNEYASTETFTRFEIH